MTNLQEQQSIGNTYCADVMDMVTEAAPSPLPDADGDGLPDPCETAIFGTDPLRIDSDDDKILDGDEDHDGLGMSNLEEQNLGGGRNACGDYDDSRGLQARVLGHFEWQERKRGLCKSEDFDAGALP